MVQFVTISGLTAEASSSGADALAVISSTYRRPVYPIFASITSGVQPRSKPGPVFTLARAEEPLTKQEKGYRILKIKGDGRCMFRALAQGLSRNKGIFMSGDTETKEADDLRLAVRDALCRGEKRKKEFKEAIFSLEATEGPIGRYCQRLNSANFWGGEVELLVLSKMLHTPIYVYKTAQEGGRSDGGVIPIQRYGEEFSKVSKQSKVPRRPVRLLYFEGNHYNLLL